MMYNVFYVYLLLFSFLFLSLSLIWSSILTLSPASHGKFIFFVCRFISKNLQKGRTTVAVKRAGRRRRSKLSKLGVGSSKRARERERKRKDKSGAYGRCRSIAADGDPPAEKPQRSCDQVGGKRTLRTARWTPTQRCADFFFTRCPTAGLLHGARDSRRDRRLLRVVRPAVRWLRGERARGNPPHRELRAGEKVVPQSLSHSGARSSVIPGLEDGRPREDRMQLLPRLLSFVYEIRLDLSDAAPHSFNDTVT